MDNADYEEHSNGEVSRNFVSVNTTSNFIYQFLTLCLGEGS